MKEYWSNLTTGKKAKLIGIVLLVIIALIFVVRNWQPTEVIFVFFRMHIPLTLIIVISGAIGFAFASLFDYRKFKVRDNEIKKLSEQLEAAKKLEGSPAAEKHVDL